jgi:broad specificity phosphatase PhoE
MIYLLRHGQTCFNVEGRYQGWSDSPLTETGRAQAMQNGILLGTHLQRAQIWSSPLPRAAETARLVAAALPGAGLSLDPRLRELGLGRCEGMTRAEIARTWPALRKSHRKGHWIFHTPGGESLEIVLARLDSLLREARLATRPECPLVLVSHGVSGRLLRALHAGIAIDAVLALEAPQDRIFRLLPGGGIDELLPIPG